MKKGRSLKHIVNELSELERQAREGEDIDLELLNEADVELEDKIDATIYVEGILEARENHLVAMKSQIQDEIAWTKKERTRLRDNLAYQLDRLGIKKIMTKLHRVTIRLSNWKMTPVITNKKVKDISELEDTDPRCIIEETTYRASPTLAKEVMQETGKIPIGFDASRKNSVIYKKGDKNEQSENSDETTTATESGRNAKGTGRLGVTKEDSEDVLTHDTIEVL